MGKKSKFAEKSADFAGEKSKFAEKSADFAGEKSQFADKSANFMDCVGKNQNFEGKLDQFHGKFWGENFAKKQSVKNSRFRWVFSGKFH